MTKKLEALRAQIAALQSERAVLEAQERNRAEVTEHVQKWAHDRYAEFAARAGTALRRVAGGDTSNGLVGLFRGAPLEYGGTDIAMPLVGLVGPDVLAAALLAHIDSVPDGPNAADRAAHIAEINSKLNGIEASEEALIEASEEAGNPIARRPNARPEIVLALPGTAAA